jgi:geranylgeranyl reductase
MNRRYDVVIIGAGPGGLECARQLQGSGLSVLILEKRKVIGPKICAGGVSHLAKIDPPEDKTRTFYRHNFHLGPQRHEVALRHPLKIVDRHDLGQYQLSRIQDSPTHTILTGTTVKAIEKDAVLTNHGRFGYRYLVGADGSSSAVRRHLGLKTKYAMGLYYNVRKTTTDLVCFLHPKLKSGYIWEFPHKHYTNIGIYYRPEHMSAKTARALLESYLKERGYSFAPSDYAAAPISYLYQGCRFGNVFLVGDAAGLALKNTGEGIPHALTSGREVARKIMDPSYDMPELKEMLRIKRKEESILRIVDALPFLRAAVFRLVLGLMKKGWK